MRTWRRWFAAILAASILLGWAAPARADETRDRQWHLRYLRIAEAHRISQGESVTVAVLDSGFETTHPDLAGAFLPGKNVFGTKPAEQDDQGHGTAMAGLIGARGRGEAGALGIAPRAMLLPVRVHEWTSNIGDHAPGAKLAEGIRWAVAQGVGVISISIAGPDTDDEKAAVEEALRANVVIVAGVGNDADVQIGFPAAYPGVIAVAGTDQNGNHEPTSATGKEVVLSAPATEVWSTAKGGGYRKGTGTSDSTAIVAGVAALIRSKYPKMSATEVAERLKATAVDKGPAGWDKEFGFGIVDPVAALTKPLPGEKSAKASAPTGSSSSTPKRALTIGLIGVVVLLAAGGVLAVVVLLRRPVR